MTIVPHSLVPDSFHRTVSILNGNQKYRNALNLISLAQLEDMILASNDRPLRTRPTLPGKPRNQWDHDNLLITTSLFSTLSESLQNKIPNDATAAAIWRLVEDRFNQQSTPASMIALHCLMNLVKDTTTSAQDFNALFISTLLAAKRLDNSISNAHVHLLYLQAIQSDMRLVVDRFWHIKGATLVDMQQAALSKDARHQLKRPTPATLFIVRKPRNAPRPSALTRLASSAQTPPASAQ
ncbi:hypothetical protein M427DRAFT_39727 [Gonapodya prolifera JEL478]|uniref:Uncharacterized protein n=1 Tax=Gonapodya prolifera (strain JEL478) TaxID=1344416 RepID=A0A138ZWW5_GONPJ|nr:hypothetical protein M427DRAFT_39727 [Gonapodya prolifera JEL478]|eukprot:KXS09002.1 hypothetical protein M427DRAFT_39727 [Gonapodya prolifera JEL478]